MLRYIKTPVELGNRKAYQDTCIVTSEGKSIGMIYEKRRADEVVRCINSHDDLLKSCIRMRKFMAAIKERSPLFADGGFEEQLDQAIEKAGGEDDKTP